MFHCFQDLFPDKATVDFGAQFSITYNNSFKVLTNLYTKPPKKYVLYQRGCPPPTRVVSYVIEIISILPI